MRNSAKLDLEHLFRDLPKYKPWLSATSWEAWEQFMATDLLKQEEQNWRLHSLLASAIKALENRSEPSTCISADTRALLAKETDTPAPVP